MTVYCANEPCETEATHVIGETETPLCWVCKEAYQMGQTSPHKHIVSLACGWCGEITGDISPDGICYACEYANEFLEPPPDEF